MESSEFTLRLKRLFYGMLCPCALIASLLFAPLASAVCGCESTSAAHSCCAVEAATSCCEVESTDADSCCCETNPLQDSVAASRLSISSCACEVAPTRDDQPLLPNRVRLDVPVSIAFALPAVLSLADDAEAPAVLESATGVSDYASSGFDLRIRHASFRC